MLHFLKGSSISMFLFPPIFQSCPALPKKAVLTEDMSQPVHVGQGQPQRLGLSGCLRAVLQVWRV